MAGKGKKSWEDHLNHILLTKPEEIVQEACQVLEKHGCPVKEELKSELYYSSTLCQVVPSTALLTTGRLLHYLPFLLRDIMRGRLLLLFALNCPMFLLFPYCHVVSHVCSFYMYCKQVSV